MKLNLEKAATEFGVDRRTLARRLKDAGHAVGRGEEYSIKDLFSALNGVDADTARQIEAERLKKMTAERKLREAELGKLEGSLLDAGDVQRVWEAGFTGLRAAIWNSDAPEADRRKWLLELRNVKHEDYLTTEKPIEQTD